MGNKIYPWIILWAVLSTVILCAPSDLYRYALSGLREEARYAMFRLDLKLYEARFGHPRRSRCVAGPLGHFGASPHTKSMWPFGTLPTLNLAKLHAFNTVIAAPELHLGVEQH